MIQSFLTRDVCDLLMSAFRCQLLLFAVYQATLSLSRHILRLHRPLQPAEHILLRGIRGLLLRYAGARLFYHCSSRCTLRLHRPRQPPDHTLLRGIRSLLPLHLRVSLIIQWEHLFVSGFKLVQSQKIAQGYSFYILRLDDLCFLHC